VTQCGGMEDLRGMVWLRENEGRGALFIGQGAGAEAVERPRDDPAAKTEGERWICWGLGFVSRFVAIWGFSSKSLGRRYENRGNIGWGLLQCYRNGCTERGEAMAMRPGFRSVKAMFGIRCQGRVAVGMEEEEGVRSGWAGAGHACK
jgi:hypothetical protein